MKRILGLSLLVALSLPPAIAQQPSSDDTPASKDDVQALFTTMHIREQMRNMMDLMGKQSKQMSQDALRRKMPDISQKELDHINAMVEQNLAGFDLDGMIDDMIPVYQRHLTKTDIAAMNQFYRTPTGQKMLREQPQMTAEAMKAAQPRIQKMMSRMMEQAETMTRQAPAESKPTDPNKN
ncbi:MAG: DUF2059 domain-containing protein [Candidatus Sulfotelmatobacter sp.]|jgi:hypothetical protein